MWEAARKCRCVWGCGCKYFSTVTKLCLFNLQWTELLHFFTLSCSHLKISTFWHSRYIYKIFWGKKYFLKPIQYRFLTCIPAEIQHKLLLWQQHVLDEYHKELTLNKPSDNLYHHYSSLKWNCFSSKTEETSSNPRFLQKDYRYQKTVSRVNYLTCSKLQPE